MKGLLIAERAYSTPCLVIAHDTFADIEYADDYDCEVDCDYEGEGDYDYDYDYDYENDNEDEDEQHREFGCENDWEG